MNKMLNGSYGITILPDEKTKDIAIKLAEDLTPYATYKVKEPHLTLYHAKFKNLPIEAARKILSKLEQFAELTFELNEMSIYGEKFLFWNIEKTLEIVNMHKIALELSLYVDNKKIARSIEEKLDLNAKELVNIKQYGYPLVNEQYMPHITLSWFENYGSKESLNNVKKKMSIKKIALVKIEGYGKIGKIII